MLEGRAEGLRVGKAEGEGEGSEEEDAVGGGVGVGNSQRPRTNCVPNLQPARVELLTQAPRSAPVPSREVENTASPVHAAALVPVHCSRAALQALPPRHRVAARGRPGRKVAEPRGDIVGEGREEAERVGLGEEEEDAEAVPVGMMQRPAVNWEPARHAALVAL